MSIGWGVRGQFGHEYGAALAGALGGMVVALLSGRPDWHRRVHYFAFFGAIGWGFGGSMSYMKNLAYTQSTDSPTVLYGFASVFLIGFCWAAPGGAGTAIAAFFNREELTRFVVPLSAVLASWYLQAVLQSSFRALGMQPVPHWMSHETSAAITIVVILITAVVRRGSWGLGSELMIYMSVGWLGGYALFTGLLDLHLNPPREDVWGQCLGLIAGILVFCWRHDFGGIGFSTVATGFLGGILYSASEAIKIAGIATGYITNWHSVMEQLQGLGHGIAIAVAFGLLIPRAPQLSETDTSGWNPAGQEVDALTPSTEPRRLGSGHLLTATLATSIPVRRWTEVFSVTFVLVLLSYLNFRKSPNDWVTQITGLKPELYGIRISGNLMPATGFIGWFDFIYLATALACIWLLVAHLRRPLALFPASWLGKGQLFYLVFLWVVVTFNFIHVLPRFTPERLVTEWFMTLSGISCTVFMLLATATRQMARTPNLDEWTPEAATTENGTSTVRERTQTSYAAWIRKAAILGLIGTVAVTFAGWGTKRALFGDGPVYPKQKSQIRFGPNNTDTIK